jgi:anti-anti-sigma factor
MTEPFVVRAPAELDVHSAIDLRREISAFLAAGVPAVVVDMGRCEFVDSTGTGALLAARREADGLGCGFRLRKPNARVLSALDHMGVRQVFDIEL